ncbi:MFS transporter [Candidatus Riesia pediculicola]|nr:MFS transporter [Candidatus Riesia pediculicola]QOJ86339.1 MFS transporter [Candidatus Riesia pediculicola]
MSKKELKIFFSLGSVFALRAFSMFMTLPAIVSYGRNLKGSTDFLLGLAIGIYGLTQAIFQIFIGSMLDRFGKKKLIIFGLFAFVSGSIVSAFSKSIWGLIIGRAFQGSGTISSSMMTTMSDLIDEKNRIKIMIMIGVNFIFIFLLTIIINPIITYFIGMRGIFFISSIFSIVSILIAILLIPEKSSMQSKSENYFSMSSIKKVIKNHRLMKLNFGICFLYILLMSNFTVLPSILLNKDSFLIDQNWKLYLVILFISFVITLPISMVLEKKKETKQIFSSCIAIFIISEIMFINFVKNFFLLLISLQIFFIVFGIMENLISTLINKEYCFEYKGTAIGIYSIFQCGGSAVGGILGGWFLEIQGIQSVFILFIITSILWFFINLNSSRLKKIRFLFRN